jgi:selenocysteine-specific elongation factor
VPTVATAGHVDHGKSTLVRALTGTDPDRLDEERRRGLTIDLGFGSCRLPSGRTLGIVDVPGHERYLTNMLAGAGAVRACLFVVAADEGWRPQSEEHLRVLELLGVRHVAVVLTRSDLVDGSRLAAAADRVRERLAASPVGAVDLVAVDARHPDAVAPVASALDRLLDAVGPAPDAGRARLWIDRCFAVPGAGTVVTGTLAGGCLAVGDRVEAGGRAARVRALQQHHGEVDVAGPGERVAVNLAGVGHRDLRRGDAVLAPARWWTTSVVDARVEVLDTLDHAVSRRGAWTLHVGSGHQPVRLRVLGAHGPLEPGTTGPVRLHLSTPLPLVVGDRFVLRESGRDETVGGGEVLDVAPVARAAAADPTGTVAGLVAERGLVDVDDLERWTGVRVAADVGRWAVDPVELARRNEALTVRVGDGGVELAELDEVDRALVARLPGVRVSAGRATLVDADGEAGDPDGGADADPEGTTSAWLTALRREPAAGHPPDGVEGEVVRRLRREGHVLRLGGEWFSREGIDAMVASLRELIAPGGGGVTIAQVRTAVGGTRRTLVPFLTWCDEQGLTRRRGDLRVAGPRLHRSAAPPAADGSDPLG